MSISSKLCYPSEIVRWTTIENSDSNQTPAGKEPKINYFTWISRASIRWICSSTASFSFCNFSFNILSDSSFFFSFFACTISAHLFTPVMYWSMMMKIKITRAWYTIRSTYSDMLSHSHSGRHNAAKLIDFNDLISMDIRRIIEISPKFMAPKLMVNVSPLLVHPVFISQINISSSPACIGFRLSRTVGMSRWYQWGVVVHYPQTNNDWSWSL